MENMTVAEVDRKIAELEQELKNVQGTECEVMARITGYYRPITNWNKGKRSEYVERMPYDIHKNPVGQDYLNKKFEEDKEINIPLQTPKQIEIKLVTQKHCPNCIPVKTKLNEARIPFEELDAMDDKNTATMISWNVFSTPFIAVLEDEQLVESFRNFEDFFLYYQNRV